VFDPNVALAQREDLIVFFSFKIKRFGPFSLLSTLKIRAVHALQTTLRHRFCREKPGNKD